MSTNFTIARPVPGEPERWNGIYGNANGMPTDAGKYLYAHVVNRFGGDLEAAARFFIDKHPGGWPCMTEAFGQLECYCHDRGEGDDAVWAQTEQHAESMDWTYVLRPEGLEVRRWAYGVVATVPWDQERTDWEVIERAGYEMS